MSSIIEDWRAIAAFHTEGLAKAEAKIQELTSAAPAPAAAAPQAEEQLLSRSAVHALVAKMASDDSKKDKADWNKLIKRGVIENIQGILLDCYSSLRAKDSNPHGWKAARELGGRDSVKWQQFGLRVIQKLYEQRAFGVGSSENDGLDDFEDTAGGCDEITWDAAVELLEATAAAAPASAPTASAPTSAFGDVAAWGFPQSSLSV